MATGILPICFGEATKVSGFLLDADKHYRVTAAFGVITDTGDADGAVIERREPDGLGSADVAAAAAALTGAQEQLPPMYSAVKRSGKRLYELAREGYEVERETRPVHVERFELLGLSGELAEFRVHCSKGTYVRTLIQDLGERLSLGAHVAALRRTRVDPFGPDAVVATVSELQAASEAGGLAALDQYLLPMDTALVAYPSVSLNEDLARYLTHGQAVSIPQAPEPGWVRLYNASEQFIGMGEVLDDARVAPRRLMAATA